MDILTSVVDQLYRIAAFLAVLGVLVFVHEYGHYIAARLCRVRVNAFSIGFGPELFGFDDKSGTRWKVAAIPLGGYVAMYGFADPTGLEAEAEAPPEAGKDGADDQPMSAEDRAVAFAYKTVGQRSLIVAAGPIANFAYAFVVLVIMGLALGRSYTPPAANEIMPGSAAERAGFQPGDLILEINGEPISRFGDIVDRVSMNLDAPMTFVVDRAGRQVRIDATPDVVRTEQFGPSSRGMLGVASGLSTVVSAVEAGSPAAEAGIEPGDRILSANGVPVTSLRPPAVQDGQPVHALGTLSRALDAAGDDPVVLSVDRDGEVVDVPLTPEWREIEVAGLDHPVVLPMIGVTSAYITVIEPIGVGEALVYGATETFGIATKTLTAIGQMISGSRGTEELGGPIRIAMIAGDVAQIGIVALIMFSVVLSVNLGLLNLFPIPVLDGGHLVFYAIEAVRGQPLRDRTQAYAFRVGLALILTLVIFVTTNDARNTFIGDLITLFSS